MAAFGSMGPKNSDVKYCKNLKNIHVPPKDIGVP